MHSDHGSHRLTGPKRFFWTLAVCIGIAISAAQSLDAAPALFGGSSEEKRTIAVNNRILAKVHGKVISVVDVQKKLDVVFYRHFPEYATSPSMRYQFYLVNWRPILNELIDKELVLADARENKLEVTRGEVRQEVESIFGPNIMASLYEVGLTYEEAREMLQGDLMIRRMMMQRVNLKALRRITPSEVKKAYLEHIQKNRIPTEWVYQVITVRHANPVKGLASATILRDLLSSQQSTLEELAKNYPNIEAIDPETKVTFSEEFKQTENEASEAYKETLASLESNSFSQPIAQQSRNKSETVHRIFYLKEQKLGGIIPFTEAENEIHSKLVNEAIAVETQAYLERMRKQAGLTKEQLLRLVPHDFEPFVLR